MDEETTVEMEAAGCAGENVGMIQNGLSLGRLGAVDFRKPEELKGRIGEYFSHCVEMDAAPTAAGLALALGCDRSRLSGVANGTESAGWPKESVRLLKEAYALMASVMEEKMLSGKIGANVGMFLLKNNFAYRDKVDVAVLPPDPLGETVPREEIAGKWKGLL